jgi:hypothetical protein
MNSMKLLHPVRDLVHPNVFVAAVHARAMNKNGDKYDNLYSRNAGIALHAHHKYFTQSMEQNSLNHYRLKPVGCIATESRSCG